MCHLCAPTNTRTYYTYIKYNKAACIILSRPFEKKKINLIYLPYVNIYMYKYSHSKV